MADSTAVAVPPALLSEVVDSVPLPLAVVDRDGVVERVNDAWRALGPALGRGHSLAEGTRLLRLLQRTSAGSPSRSALADGLAAVLAGDTAAWRAEVCDEPGGAQRWWRAKVGALPSGGAVLTLSEITDLKLVQESLSHQAVHDPLTGLPNRTVLEERLAAPRAHRAVLFLDVDDFKLVNDGYGHEVGDALLVEVARRLREVAPPEALVVRFGGDEFVVLVEDVLGEVHLLGLADALLGAFVAPFDVGGAALVVTASVGVASGAGSSLLGDADAALFDAKARGRARHALSDEGLRGRTRNRLEVTQALRRAVDAGELVLHHQPVIDLTDGGCYGVETLLRWERPGVGRLTPAHFLPVAEEAGLVVPLGEWVLEEAVRQAAAWAAQGRPLSVAVNLSPRQLVDRGLVTRVEEALARHSVPPSLLRVEVTESAALDSSEGEEALHDLHDLGIGVAVDDFGTGYSSLARLRHLPGVDTLKVDRSFVRGLPHVQDDVEIVTAVLRLAGALGLVVVAEGVETVAQRDWLTRAGCELGQGWLFGAALPASQVLPWLDRRGARQAC